jgi:DNA-binding CsgD family transcriptional regulator
MQMSATEYEDSLAHYGILRKSGRYPWGSGQNPNQRSKTFLDILKEHEREGLSQAQIAKLYQEVDANGERIPSSFTVADLRAIKSRAVNIQKQDQIRQAQRLKDKGMGFSEIGRRMNVNESTVRSLLEPGRLEKLDILHQTAEMLKRQVAEKGQIDVGAHVERDLPLGTNTPESNFGISKDKFNTALAMLKEEGYAVTTYKEPQQGTGELTTRRVLLKPSKRNMSPEAIQREAWLNRANTRLISEKSKDHGRTWQEEVFQKPLNVDSKRIGVRYKEDGGIDADGVIYVRPGVKDLSLGKSQYAQVRVAVDGTHFLKGMAVYKDDLPKGVDLVFNTSKSSTGNKHDAMKPLRRDKEGNVDWTNPFGSFPKIEGGQLKDKDGNVYSAMNVLNEQGDWSKWSRNLSAQMLSKQKPELIKTQLDLTHDRRRQDFEEIRALTNPLIKRKLLESFSDDVDSAAVQLKATNMPRQATKVILPVTSMKPDEVYAPTFKNGERVALVRFPHAGTFEIPILTVNNRNKEAEKLFTKKGTKELQAPDAIGIHPKVAERLSGADFDGDHVVMIPNSRGQVRNRDPLEKLRGFDPRAEYKPYDGMKTIDGGVYNAKTGAVDYGKHPDGRPRSPKTGTKNNEMGKVTNLISDMTLRGASDDEIGRAVRHSMVVIDAEKHSLDYKASERDHGILNLKRTYQGVNEKTGQPRGASTLITRATSRSSPDPVKRKDAPADHPGLHGKGVTRLSNATVDNKTGEKVYVPTGEINKNTGEPRTFRSRKLAETKNAFDLVSEHGGTDVEKIYAEHSNRLKALANEVRLEAARTEPIKRNKSSAKVYHKEVESLNAKLDNALKNAPLERQAQAMAAQIVAQRRRANPDMEESEKKKIRGQALEQARARTGAKKHRVDIEDREWEAIQAGAISIESLKKILSNTDIDKLKERATPRLKPVMTSNMERRAKQLRSSGATYAEISDALGIPESTLQASLEGG